MRFTYKVTLTAFTVVLATSAVVVSSAFAAPEWYAATPEWRQGGAALSKAVATKWKGRVKNTDTKEGVTVECEDTGEGSVGPGAVDAATKWSFTNCVSHTEKGAICEEPKMEAANLSWHTELSISSGIIHDMVTSGGKGTPGFITQCKVFGFRVEDQCIGAFSAGVTNVTAGVNASLTAEKIECTLSGGVGKLEGTQLIEATAGGKLEVTATGVFAKLAGPHKVEGKGEIAVTDSNYYTGTPVTITCKIVNISGELNTAGLGSISSYTVNECKASGGACLLKTVKSLNIPWKTELYESSGLRDRLVSGGNGTPEWEFTCEVAGSSFEDVCGFNTSAATENASEGNVIMKFNEQSNRTWCTRGGLESGKLKGEITIVHPTNVGAIEVKK